MSRTMKGVQPKRGRPRRGEVPSRQRGEIRMSSHTARGTVPTLLLATVKRKKRNEKKQRKEKM